MASLTRMSKLSELDRLVNDPNVLLDASRVWDLLDELAGGDASFFNAANQTLTSNPARRA